MNYIEVGSIEAFLSGITTLKDGSVKVSFELNPENKTVINNLMNCYLADKKLFTIGIMRCENKQVGNDE